jgi:hypothetical protein
MKTKIIDPEEAMQERGGVFAWLIFHAVALWAWLTSVLRCQNFTHADNGDASDSCVQPQASPSPKNPSPGVASAVRVGRF